MIGCNEGRKFSATLLSGVALRARVVGFVAIALLGSVTAEAKIIYVNAKRDVSGDGSSWEKAIRYLQPALGKAVPGDSIYLAKGTYYPDDGVLNGYGDREISFELNKVTLYGGFEGDEARLDMRNPKKNPTILSGGIWEITPETLGYDRYWSLHVVKVIGSSTLDGLIVEKGRASGEEAPFNQGGGCYVVGGQTVTLNDCIFRKNMASQSGGAIWGTVEAENCLFEKNFINNEYNFNSNPKRLQQWLFSPDGSGAAIAGNVTAKNCKFIRNYLDVVSLELGSTSSAKGGAIAGTTINVTECLFEGNIAATYAYTGPNESSDGTASGGAIHGATTASKCQFIGNVAYSSAAFGSYGSQIFSGAVNPATYGGAIYGNVSLVACLFSENHLDAIGRYAPQTTHNCAGSAVHTLGQSSIDNCVFVSNSSDARDYVFNPRFNNNNFSVGALYIPEGSEVPLSNSTFWNNSSAHVYSASGGTTRIGSKGAAIACDGSLKLISNIIWYEVGSVFTSEYKNAIHIGGRGRISNRLYPTPSTETINDVMGGFDNVTRSLGANVDFGEPAERTFIDLNPEFVDRSNPIGPDGIWGTEDDGLRIKANSPVIGKGVRTFVALDTADLDHDGNVTEEVPADFAGFVRVQRDSLDLGAYEFGNHYSAPTIDVRYQGNSLTSGSSVVDLTDYSQISRTFTIKNTGFQDLRDLLVTGTGPDIGDFKFTQPLKEVLKPGDTTTFTVTLNSKKNGPIAGKLLIASNDILNTPFVIGLEAIARQPDIAVQDQTGRNVKDNATVVDFGLIAAGDSTTQTFTILNTKLGNLKITSVTPTGPDAANFVVSPPAKDFLLPGETTKFDVTFSPAGVGNRDASIIIVSNDPDSESTFVMKLEGKGYEAPEILVSQPLSTEIKDGDVSDFGQVEKSLLYSKTFVIQNTSVGVLKNLSVSLTGSTAFTATPMNGDKIQPGDRRSFEVIFMPTSVGAKTATLVIKSNDPDESSITILLTGECIAISSIPASSGFASISPTSDAHAANNSVTETKASDGLKYLTLTVEKPKGWIAKAHQVEVSTDLLDWFSGKNFTTTLVDSATLLQVRDNTPVTDGKKRYIRLK